MLLWFYKGHRYLVVGRTSIFEIKWFEFDFWLLNTHLTQKYMVLNFFKLRFFIFKTHSLGFLCAQTCVYLYVCMCFFCFFSFGFFLLSVLSNSDLFLFILLLLIICPPFLLMRDRKDLDGKGDRGDIGRVGLRGNHYQIHCIKRNLFLIRERK